jgi:hypothetical protein
VQPQVVALADLPAHFAGDLEPGDDRLWPPQ